MSGTATEGHIYIDVYGPYLEEQYRLAKALLLNCAVYFEAMRGCEKCEAEAARLTALKLEGKWPPKVER